MDIPGAAFLTAAAALAFLASCFFIVATFASSVAKFSFSGGENVSRGGLDHERGRTYRRATASRMNCGYVVGENHPPGEGSHRGRGGVLRSKWYGLVPRLLNLTRQRGA